MRKEPLQEHGDTNAAVLCPFVCPQMNDYMAAYHDAVLLIGQVMRKIISKNESEVEQMEFMNVNYFRNTSFNGKREEANVVDLVN